MTQLSQDFTAYAGDVALIVFTVADQNGVAIDISTVTEITWTLRRTLDATILLTKTKTSSGGITLTSDGTDGKFQVALTGTDTTALSGYYLHQSTVTDATGKVTTVALGRMQVGVAPVWTYSGDPTTSTKDAVRFLIGDTIEGDPQLQDGEINYTLTARGNVYGAASQCCRALSAQMSRQADSVQGELRVLYSARAKAYAARAAEYDRMEALLSGSLAYAGGISISDKTTREQDTDRTTPNFNRGMMDSSLPIGQGPNEYPSSTNTDEAGS